ncbi:unnamed protein product [Gongylonema pulchrum]|uniref:Uncharacterized protein n=1 Tax=Gongylonema pulchrum TaxID=637853 RepID=A0A3P7N6H0_9BILA|nr:unnamed protein product [Gongylonema pulchrum]
MEKAVLSLVDEFGELSGVNDMGWALLAKLVYACNHEMLRLIASRIQKRLIVAAKQPVSVPLLHFVRSFLVRFPWLKACNEQTLACIAAHAVDFAVENFSMDIVRLVSGVYALYAGNKYDRILTKTLKNVMRDSIIEDGGEGIIVFETATQHNRTQFVATIFRVHAAVMKHAFKGGEVRVDEWLDMAHEALNISDAEIDKSVFTWLRTYMIRAGSCAQVSSRRMSALFIDFHRPSEAYYSAVQEFIQLGANSTANTLFGMLIHSPLEKLHSEVSFSQLLLTVNLHP